MLPLVVPRTRRIGIQTITLHFRHERARRRHSEDFVLPCARACQSIIRIGLLKFLGTDGERMDIHSFGPALTKASSLARSIPFGFYDIYVHGHMLSDSAHTTIRRGSRACHLISWLTPARLIVSAVEGALRCSMRLCPHRRRNAQRGRFLRPSFHSSLYLIMVYILFFLPN